MIKSTENKLKFSKTSTGWTIEHILNGYREQNENPIVVNLAKIASIIPVNNAWLERGARAVKRIKSRTRRSMKNDFLNASLHISLKGPTLHSKEADLEVSLERKINEYNYNMHIDSESNDSSFSDEEDDDK